MRWPSRTLTLELAWRPTRRGAIGLCPYTGLDVEESGTHWLCCARTNAPVALHALARAFPRQNWTPPREAAWSRVHRPFRLRLDTAKGAAMAVACFRSAMGRSRAFFTAAERARLALQVISHVELAHQNSGLGWPAAQADLARWVQTEARPPALRLLHRTPFKTSAALGPHLPALSAPLARLRAQEHEAWLPASGFSGVTVRL